MVARWKTCLFLLALFGGASVRANRLSPSASFLFQGVFSKLVFEPVQAGGQLDEGRKVAVAFLVASAHSTATFQALKYKFSTQSRTLLTAAGRYVRVLCANGRHLGMLRWREMRQAGKFCLSNSS
jgi:hypothetical protein